MHRLAVTASLVLVIALVSGLAWTSAAAGRGPRDPQPLVASAEGRMMVEGQETIVEVLVAVPPGADASHVARTALRRNYPEAAPLTDAQSSGFTTTGLIWDNPAPPVVVNYNHAGNTLDSAKAELLAALETWDAVPTSSFSFTYGADTARCPSLVQECRGPQKYDGNNDIGWININDPTVLGVTWYSTTRDEFDMAIDNTNFTWVAGCAGNYSLRTVYLHELGHALGLGHSSDTSAVMYAYYGGPRCALTQDDVDGVSALYPDDGTTPAPTNTPTATNTPDPSSPTATATPCPRGWVKQGRC
jgi:hypothetical protein